MTLELLDPQVAEKERYGVYPYAFNKKLFPDNMLEKLYYHLQEDGIYREVMHEHALSKNEFVEFMGMYPHTILSICVDARTNEYHGFSWVSDIHHTDSMLKGCGSFAFFRKHWNQRITEIFGMICVSQWFRFPWKLLLQGEEFDTRAMPTDQGFDLIFGMTPKPNRLAQRYVRNVGFTYVATVPGFTTYRGETVDGLVATQTKEQFKVAEAEYLAKGGHDGR